jgi:hypothetical protein
MSISKFILIAIIWLADMGALVTLAPIGRHAYLFALLFCLGHVLMILLVQKFPSGLSAGKAWIIILGLGVCARLLFLAYPAGNDVFRYVWEGHLDVIQVFFLCLAVHLILSKKQWVAGGVGMRFEPQVSSTRLLAGLNNLRAVLTGICFGDQAQFFRAEALAAMGGFPPMMLMEDVELSLRLKELGRLAFLRRGIRVSGRRWQADGFFASLMTVFFLFPRYLAERRFFGGGQMNQSYYDIYYGRSKNPKKISN